MSLLLSHIEMLLPYLKTSQIIPPTRREAVSEAREEDQNSSRYVGEGGPGGETHRQGFAGKVTQGICRQGQGPVSRCTLARQQGECHLSWLCFLSVEVLESSFPEARIKG